MTRRASLHPRATGMALLLLIALDGCQGTAGLNLTGREFLSHANVEGVVAFDLVPGTPVRLGFTETNVTASAGCNTFGATYRLGGGQLLIDGGAMTEMGCDNARDTQDQWLFTFLGSKPAI